MTIPHQEDPAPHAPGAEGTPSGRARRYREAELRRDGRRNLLLFILAQAGSLVYVGWLVTAINWDEPWLGGPFLAAELICVVSVFLWGEMLTRKRAHPPEGLPWPGDPPPVDVFVAVCREPVQIVGRTLAAVARIDYPHARVLVLDDGHDDEVRRLAEGHGFDYVTRNDRQFAKAGNLNHGLAASSAPFVMTLDADQVPQPEIIHRLIGFFQVPRIGIVASRQSFTLPPGDPWGNRDAVFYEAMQLGKNDANAAISCGSGSVYRRTALDEIGGFPTWTLVEDLYTSLLCQQHGWRVVYYPFALAEGTAPTDVFAQHRQRWQWAVDSLRILLWRNPLFTPGLGFRQRLNYFYFGWHYIMYGIAYPIFFTLPIWSLFTGQLMITAPITVFLAYRLPYLLFMRLMTVFLTDRTHDFKAFQMQFGLWPIYLSAICTALTHPVSRPTYHVTPKIPRHTTVARRLLALLPNLAAIGCSAAAIVAGIVLPKNDPFVTAVLCFWCGWTIVALSRFTWVGLTGGRPRAAPS